ncbi:MAG: hypothetical protein SGARI_006081, partial [Bacillariaceae sp.]
IQNHIGNQYMLTLVQHYRVEYDNISRADKYRIVEDIMGSISAKGGRFMEHVDSEEDDNGYWKEVSRQNAYNKVTHCFRSLRRANLPPDERRGGGKKGKKDELESDIVCVPGGVSMPPMMHHGMMGYGATGFPPPPPMMMNPAEMGYMPWGPAAMPMDAQQAMWAQHQHQQSTMGGGGGDPSNPESVSKDAASASSGEGKKDSVYEV